LCHFAQVAYSKFGRIFPGIESLDDRIALASRHVEDGRRFVEQQRILIAEGRGMARRDRIAQDV
jgi:hypothetical protein